MKSTWIIAEREIRSFFSTPMAYVLMVVWLIWNGIGFTILSIAFASGSAGGAGENPLNAFFGGTILFHLPLLAIIPAISMRLIAEEQRSGSLETLLSAPVTEASVVVGKYIAALVFWCILWLPTLLYVWLTSQYGHIDIKVIASSYLGVFGVGAHYMAVGLLASTIARTPLTAFMLTFLLIGMLFVAGISAFVVQDEMMREIAGYMSVWQHMEDFSKGIVDSRHLVYDATLVVLPLFIAHRIFVARRLA